jgi:carbamoyltransferase
MSVREFPVWYMWMVQEGYKACGGEWNSRFYDLIQDFFARTGIPLVLNTSFNVMGRPIMHSVEDAISLFFTTGLDALIMGDYLLTK